MLDTAVPEVLNALLIKDYIDAMGCHIDIAEMIVEKEADSLMAVKGEIACHVSGSVYRHMFVAMRRPNLAKFESQGVNRGS